MILEEAHMVLQIAQPLRVVSLMDTTKEGKDAKEEQVNKQNSVEDHASDVIKATKET